MTPARFLGVGLTLAALCPLEEAGAQAGQSLQSLFPPAGCSPTSRINPCRTRTLPAPVGDPTDGPLTDAFRDGPLDPPEDPLGYDAPRIELAPLRLNGPKDPLGMGNGH